MEGQELEKIESKEAAPFELNIDDVKRYIAPKATDKELFMFMGIAKSLELNPFLREIHFIKYGDNPGQTVVGYSTYIKRAERTGLLDGWECTSDGKKAFVTIYRKDRSKPFKWEVDKAEFDSGQSTWKKMPSFMLKKVAIAQAFRLCFPEDLGGLPYMPEEIVGTSSESLPSGDPGQERPTIQEPQKKEPEAQPQQPIQSQQEKQEEKATEPQSKMLWAKMKNKGIEPEVFKEVWNSNPRDLPRRLVNEAIAWIEKYQA